MSVFDDLRPLPGTTVTADEIWVRIQRIWNSLHYIDIQCLIEFTPRHKAELIAVSGRCTTHGFQTLNIAFLFWKVIICFYLSFMFLHHISTFTNMNAY